MAIPCKHTDIFADLEKQLYEHYPDYEESNNYFTCNGNVIKRFKSLDENTVKQNLSPLCEEKIVKIFRGIKS